MAKRLTIIMGFIGFCAGVIYAVGGFFYDLLTTGSLNWGTALAFLALIGMPLIFACVGYIIGMMFDSLIDLLKK
ncbi:MAG: hypothetical protein AAFV93_00605 [Chloroflexota bacterium]